MPYNMSYENPDPFADEDLDIDEEEDRMMHEDEHWDMKFEQLRDDAMDKEVELASSREGKSGAVDQKSHEDLGTSEDTAVRGVDDGEDHLVFDTSRRLESMWHREPKDSGGRFRSERG